MKIYKITYRAANNKGIWRTKYSLRYARSQDEAISLVDCDVDLIKQVEFLGYKKGTTPQPLDKQQ